MKVSIIIVTWNSVSTLSRCVESILLQVREPEIEVILVDNQSRDTAYLDPYRNRPQCIVIDNPANLGYAKANNIGAARARGEYLLILNPDMVFLDNPLPRLIAALQADRSLGAVAPLLVEQAGAPPKDGYYFKFPNLLQTLLVRTLLDRFRISHALSSRWCHSALPAAGWARVDQLPGAFLLFRRETVPGPQVLSEDYFIWMEDVDFCKRLADRKLAVAVLTDAKVVHIGGVSFMQWSHWRKRRIFSESYVTYIAAHSGALAYRIDVFLLVANSLAVLVLFALRNLARGHWSRLREEAAAESPILAFLLRSLIRRPKRAG